MSRNITLVINNNTIECDCAGEVTEKNPVTPKRRLREPRRIVQRKVAEIGAEDTDACLSVWQSVVVQSFYDLLSEAENYEQKLDRANAIAWFGQGVSKTARATDFETVCELALLDAQKVMQLARRIIRGEKNSAISGFNFRTLRKDSSNRRPRRNKQGK